MEKWMEKVNMFILMGMFMMGNGKMIKGIEIILLKCFRHGKGVVIYAAPPGQTPERYEGDFRDGKMHGYGVYTYSDGGYRLLILNLFL
jgi:hypothetical protein